LGTDEYHAYSIGHDGKIVVVAGSNKLAQQIAKILTEKKRTTGYGFDLSVLTGTLDQSSITAVKSEVFRCMQYLMSIQNQERLEGYAYIPSEEISSVSSLDAYIASDDPRKMYVSVAVVTKAGTTAAVSNIPIRN
jgi:hypothetical protein